MNLISLAKNLRTNSTPAERKLWYNLRAGRFYNLKFRRQYPYKNFILDFVCFEKNLVIELDGGQHNFEKNAEKDSIRDKILTDNNFKVLRFWNNEINENLNGTLETIARECGVLE